MEIIDKIKEAPEKIYIHPDIGGREFTRSWSKRRVSQESVEYTRTDTLEVPDVNLEKELDEWMRYGPHTNYPWCTIPDAIRITAEHFFKLGLKANQENNVMGILEREVKIDAGGYPYINCDIEFYDYDKDIPLAKEGDKVKVILVKGE